MHRSIYLATFATVLLSACGGPVVRSAKGTPPAVNEDLTWISYNLPLRLYTVRFERSFAETAQYRQLVASTASVKAAAALVSATENALRAARAQELSDPGSAAYKGEVRKQEFLLAEYRRLLDAANVDAIKAQAQFDQTKTFARNCGFEDRLSVAPARYVADPEARYYAVFDHRSWRNDQLKLSTTTSGLLTSGAGDVTDRSGEVAQGVVRLLSLPTAMRTSDSAVLAGGGLKAGARTLMALPPIVKAQPSEDRLVPPNFDKLCAGTAPFVLEAEIDPVNTGDLDRLKSALHANGAFAEFRATPLGAETQLSTGSPAMTCAAWPSAMTPDADHPRSDCAGGLFHRRSRPAVMRWYREAPRTLHALACGQTPGCVQGTYLDGFEAEQGGLLQSMALELPNGNDVEFIAFATGALTRSTNTVAFDNGMLTTIDSNRPSELVAALALPVDIARVPLTLVADLLTIRLQTTTKESELLAAGIELRRRQVLAEEARAGYFGGTPPTRPIPPPAQVDDD